MEQQEKKKVFYYPCKNELKPLIVLMGFFNCSESNLKKYMEIWDENEYNLILFYPPLDFSMQLMKKGVYELLKCIHVHFKVNKSIDDHEIDIGRVTNYIKNEIYIHGISAGTVCTATLLKYIKTIKNGKYQYLLPYIKGIILDSGVPVKIEDFQNGFSCSLKELPIIRKNLNHPLTSLIFKSMNVYKSLWIEFLKDDMSFLFNNNFNYLLIYSDNDPFFKDSCKIWLDRIKSNKFEKKNIIEIKFDSFHGQHLKKNPKQYKESIKELLKLSIKL